MTRSWLVGFGSEVCPHQWCTGGQLLCMISLFSTGPCIEMTCPHAIPEGTVVGESGALTPDCLLPRGDEGTAEVDADRVQKPD